ncbi:F-box protein At2g23160-like [Silene latifolia]|uniref:F-box protein At2g23160-like n=1 Tax=Silene latifolia TaxID=37657 RepID=UPI003D775056
MMSKKKTKTSIKYLPIEIWYLILARMPSKTLLRFRSVCKPWCSIIDDADFVHLHLQLCNMNNNTRNKLFLAFESLGLSSQKGCLVTVRRADTFRKTSHNLPSFKNYSSSGCCNGLLLMCTNVDENKELRLWNPSIRKSLLIPSCPLYSPSNHNCRTAFVFGFAPSTKEHKIIALAFDHTHPKDMFIAVYRLSDQRWTAVRKNGFNIERSCFRDIFWAYCCPSNTVFFQGVVHCTGNKFYGDYKNYLISLDFDSEKFTFLKLPYFSGGKLDTKRFLFILGESVAFFCISKVYTNIWVLEHDAGKRVWTLWHSRTSTRDGFDLFMAITYSKPFYYESDHGGCLMVGKGSYHIASGQVLERGKSMRKFVHLETYSESLVLHKGYGAQDDVFPGN